MKTKEIQHNSWETEKKIVEDKREENTLEIE